MLCHAAKHTKEISRRSQKVVCCRTDNVLHWNRKWLRYNSQKSYERSIRSDNHKIMSKSKRCRIYHILHGHFGPRGKDILKESHRGDCQSTKCFCASLCRSLDSAFRRRHTRRVSYKVQGTIYND